MKKPRDKEALVDKLLEEIEGLKAKNTQLRNALKAIFGYAKNRHTDIHLESYNKAIKEAEQALKEK